MKDTTDSLADVMPSAAPSDEDIRKWEALPRDEQLRRLRDALTHPECRAVTSESMSDILAAVRSKVDTRRG